MRLGLFSVIIRELGCKIIKYLIILYNTTNMADSVSDGQNRLVYHNDKDTLYRVTIPSGWVSNHGNQLDSTGEWRWGDLYQESHGDLPELPDNIKARFDLNGPLPVPVQERARDDEAPAVVEKRVRYVEGAERREPDEEDLFGARGIGRRGGKSKKRPTRRGRSSKARKARKSRKARKARTTRRR